MHACDTAGADVRLCIRHFITWDDGSPSPVEMSTPSASNVQMNQVKIKCQESNSQQVKVKTRCHDECQNCVKLRSKLHRTTQEHNQQTKAKREEHKNIEIALKNEIEKLRQQKKTLEEELTNERKESVRARGDRHIDVRTSVIAAVLSGLQFWQFKRFFQITGTLGLCSRKKWDSVVVEMYHAIKQVVKHQHENLAVGYVNKKNISCAADCRWSHVGHHAKHCTAIVVDAERNVIISRVHVSKYKNTHDAHMHVFKESSGAMEVTGLKICFKKIKDLGYNVRYCSFDGDSESRKALYSYFPYGIAVRDPSHQGKNSGKMLARVGNEFKYTCECDYVYSQVKPDTKKKDSSGKFLKDHNYITTKRVKDFAARVSYILMHNTSRAEVRRKIKGAMNHMFGKCGPNDGCTHASNYVHVNPVNCPQMIQAIEKYIANEVLSIVEQTIIEKKGAISTNSAEGVMSMIKEMIGKKRFCGIVLYCVRADVAILCKNQKWYTKQFKSGQSTQHVHWLPTVLQSLKVPTTETQERIWREESINRMKEDEKQKTESAKLKRIVKKKSKLKSHQDAKKKSAKGVVFSHESRGGDRRLQAQRDRTESIEYDRETQQGNGNTVTTTIVPKDRVDVKRFGQKKIKKYLQQKLDAAVFEQLPATRSKGWLKKWRDALQNYIISIPGDTIEVPSDWVSNTTTNTNPNPLPPPGTLLEWNKSDPRLGALKKVQIRGYLQDKIPDERFQELIALGTAKGVLQKWRDAIVNYAKSLPGESIQVPGEWRDVQPPTKTKGGITTELDLANKTVIKVYLDLETTGLSIYTSSILSLGLACYLQDEKLGTWESYIYTNSDFPLSSTNTHGIYPINYPRDEPSKLCDAPKLQSANNKIYTFLTEMLQKVKDRQLGKEVILHLITWNGNTFDLPMWVLNTDEVERRRGAWRNSFGELFTAFSDYKNVTPNLGIQPTADQLRVWETKNAVKLSEGKIKKMPTKWKTPGVLGDFYRDYVGREIVNYHSALVDALALHEIEVSCEMLKLNRNKWRTIKHLAKPIRDVLKRVEKNALTYGDKYGHIYSRAPYGARRPNCHHSYPCSISVYKDKSKTKTNITFKCNAEFNGKMRNREKGEDKRCSFRMSGEEWIREQNMAENMQIALDFEGNRSVRL